MNKNKMELFEEIIICSEMIGSVKRDLDGCIANGCSMEVAYQHELDRLTENRAELIKLYENLCE